MIQLFIGGVRSGKSDAAEHKLSELMKLRPQLKPAYIATSVAFGEETIARIQKHQHIRQSRFSQTIITYELDYQKSDLLSVLSALDTNNHVVLIECLSTWVGWYLSANNTLQENINIFEQKKNQLLTFLANAKCEVIIVSGEVGCGLIGETALQRRYVDKLGELNQQIATMSEHVYLLTAGLQQTLK